MKEPLESGLWEPKQSRDACVYESRGSHKGVETERRTRRGEDGRAAIASTFSITSTRINIFKLILTSHPSSHSTPFSGINYRSLYHTNFWKFLKKTLHFSTIHSLISILNSVVLRGSIDRSLLTQRSMRIYILSRSGIAARMCADISLYTLCPEFFKRITRSCETLTLVTIRFLRRKAVHLDSIEKSAPMKYAWR